MKCDRGNCNAYTLYIKRDYYGCQKHDHESALYAESIVEAVNVELFFSLWA